MGLRRTEVECRANLRQGLRYLDPPPQQVTPPPPDRRRLAPPKPPVGENVNERSVLAAEFRERLLDPAIMGPPIVWLASKVAEGVHNERIVAREFEAWLPRRSLAS